MHNANNIQIATAACAYCELHPIPQELTVCQSMQFLTLILSLAILHMHYKQRILEWKSFVGHPADLRQPEPLLQLRNTLSILLQVQAPQGDGKD